MGATFANQKYIKEEALGRCMCPRLAELKEKNQTPYMNSIRFSLGSIEPLRPPAVQLSKSPQSTPGKPFRLSIYDMIKKPGRKRVPQTYHHRLR